MNFFHSLGQLVKNKFPDYRDKNEFDLGRRVADKFPEYKRNQNVVMQKQQQLMQGAANLGANVVRGVGDYIKNENLYSAFQREVAPGMRQAMTQGYSSLGPQQKKQLVQGALMAGVADVGAQGAEAVKKGIKSVAQPPKGDMKLYHGTSEGAARNIQRSGLKTGQAIGSKGDTPIYFSDAEDYAQTYANRKSASPAMLRVSGSKEIIADPNTGLKGDFKTTKPIPPEDIEIRTPDGTWVPLKDWDFNEKKVKPQSPGLDL